LSKPRAWGWDAVAEHADLPELSRGRYLLVESFKKYLMPDDFKGEETLRVSETRCTAQLECSCAII